MIYFNAGLGISTLSLLLLQESHVFVNGSTRTIDLRRIKPNSNPAWTPELFEELLMTNHGYRSESIHPFITSNVLHSDHSDFGISFGSRLLNEPYRIETSEHRDISTEKQQPLGAKIISTSFLPSGPSVFSKLQSRMNTRLHLATKMIETGKHIVSKSTHFALTSASSRSLGAKLASDCYALLGQDSNNISCDNIHSTYLGKGYLLVRNNSQRLTKNLPRKVLQFTNRKKHSSQKAIPKGILTEIERVQLIERTETLMESVLHALENDKLWNQVNQQDGVTVWKALVDVKNYHPIHNSSPKEDADSATIRSEAILNASPEEVYNLFSDDNRVHEYNENCNQLEDLELISENSKINWSATGKFGPFSARDFVTLVTFRYLGPQKGYLSLCASVEHPKLAPNKNGFVRSQIQLAATFMEPVDGQPNKTRFIQVMQVGSLGGVADSPMAKRIKRNLEIKAPVEFVHKFNAALEKNPPSTGEGGDMLTKDEKEV